MYSSSMETANQQFKELVWPKMSSALEEGDWDLVSVEDSPDPKMHWALDVLSGIDWIAVNKETKAVYTMAVRVQEGRVYRTFTVRDRRSSGGWTEYDKRMTGLWYGSLMPLLTVQAYVNDNGITVAIVRTKDLLDYEQIQPPEIRRAYDQDESWSSFRIYEWDPLKEWLERVGRSFREIS